MAIRLRVAQKGRGRVGLFGWITFSRAGSGGFALLILAALPLFGCAPAQPPMTAQPQAAGPAGPDDATIAAIRPIPPPGTRGGSDPQADILAAMGRPAAAAAAGPASAEIILRRDDGDTLSVVQTESAALSPGERVMVLPGVSGPRLVPITPAS